MSDAEPLTVTVVGATVNISRELLDAYQSASSYSAFGHRTAEDVRAADAVAAAFAAERAAARRQYETALPRLLLLFLSSDVVTRGVLSLHRPVGFATGQRECGGCDLDGYEVEPPAWPCSTTRLVAEAHGIELPADFSFDEACR